MLDDPAIIDTEQLTHDLTNCPQVGLWLERLMPATNFNQIHSSKATSYENAMGKLVQLGCRGGIAAFDERTQPFRRWFKQQTVSSDFDWSPFLRMIVGSFLIIAGYHEDNALNAYLEQRVDTLWSFTRERNFNIYADREDYPDIPKSFREKPLVKPELYIGGEARFPTIYDIHAFAHYTDKLKKEAIENKLDTVIDYVLDPNYQEFPDGYGLMRAGKRRYYAIGWSVHLQGYKGFDVSGFRADSFIQRLLLLAHFRTARNHRWFQESLEHLEGFRTEQGVFSFPRSYLRERRSGYWVTGAYMGLEEDRRTKFAIELESTFWMLKIKKTAALI